MAPSLWACGTARQGFSLMETERLCMSAFVGKHIGIRAVYSLRPPDTHRPRRYFAQWRLMFDPFYMLSLSPPGQLCDG